MAADEAEMTVANDIKEVRGEHRESESLGKKASFCRGEKS